MSHPSPSECVKAAVREMREVPTPQLDWTRVEEQLLRRIEQEPVKRSRQTRWGRVALCAAAAAAAVLIGLKLREAVRSVPAEPRVSIPVPAPTAVDGDGLPAGKRLESGSEKLRVEHRGQAAWTLAPHSAARLVAGAPVLTVQLEAGAVRAEVVSRRPPESFAVHVGKTRIAAHGTAFRVALQRELVFVEVSEGAVAVGSTKANRQTRNWLLTAPSKGVFSSDGAVSGRIDGVAQPEREPEPPPADAPTSARASSRVRAAKSAPANAQPPATLSPELADAAAAQVVRGIEACFDRHTEIWGNVRVTASSTLTMFVSPSGKLETMRLVPQLAPPVQYCSVALMRQVRFPRSQAGGTVTRVLRLRK
jgi:hypothetical protein